MALPYMLINEHAPEMCAAYEAGIPKVSEALKGKEFWCPCPYGVHGFYLLLEADSAEHAMAQVPEELQRGTKAIPMETFVL